MRDISELEDKLVDAQTSKVEKLPMNIDFDAWRLTLEYIDLGRIMGICSQRPLVETYKEMCERYPLLYEEARKS